MGLTKNDTITGQPVTKIVEDLKNKYPGKLHVCARYCGDECMKKKDRSEWHFIGHSHNSSKTYCVKIEGENDDWIEQYKK